jgi:AbrB family looped-hinge helix DNA binding protein
LIILKSAQKGEKRQKTFILHVPTNCVGDDLESVVDEKGRLLIPQSLRERIGITSGTVVKMREKGEIVEIVPTSRKRRTWKDLHGIKPKRTGKPSWPTPEEIKSIWE